MPRRWFFTSRTCCLPAAALDAALHGHQDLLSDASNDTPRRTHAFETKTFRSRAHQKQQVPPAAQRTCLLLNARCSTHERLESISFFFSRRCVQHFARAVLLPAP